MIEKLGSVTLKNGGQLELELITPPAGTAYEELVPFLGHKPEVIREVIYGRLRGDYAADSADFFFVGRIGGRIAGHIWYGYGRGHDRPIANFGEVYVAPEFRGLQVCSRIMDVLMPHLRQSPAASAFCTTEKEYVCNHYCGYGFRKLFPEKPYGQLMVPLDPAAPDFSSFAAKYYRGIEALPVTATPGTIAYRHEIECLLKFYYLYEKLEPGYVFAGNLGGGYFSGYYQTLLQQAAGNGKLFTALLPDGRCVGWGFVMDFFPGTQSLPVLDFQLHPAIRQQAGGFVASMLEQTGNRPCVFFGSERQAAKLAAAETAGMRRRATLHGGIIVCEN